MRFGLSCRKWFTERAADLEIRQAKYPNNIVEQDHRAIKRQVRPMMGFLLVGRRDPRWY
jgi:transposase-like protein